MGKYEKFKHHHMDGHHSGRHSCFNCGSQFSDMAEHKNKPTVHCPFCKQENINFVSYQHQKD